MEKWFVLRKGADFEKIAAQYGISPLLARLIRNRDVIGDEAIHAYLNGGLTDLYDGMRMKDMPKAIEILMEKIQKEAHIRIIGDYDIDGINATYILLKGIETLGGTVDYDIPDRMKDGYGLNRVLIDRAFEDGVDTIVTCDNGIAAAAEIQYGKELGMTMIVTDHHEVPFEECDGKRRYLLPDGDAVVDPKRTDCEYPFKELCGAAVAYKLVECLFQCMGRDTDEMEYLIEHAAIATIGDVMDLQGENRIIVKEGLKRLGQTKNRGLKALMECTKVPADRLSSYHIGFILGPCLNASGRLSTAKRALEMLCAEEKREADILAGDLKALNDSRKDMTMLAVEQAVKIIEESDLKEDKVLVVYLEDCHESLAGIVAGRIRERYYKPTLILTKGEEGIKGSGRSIEAYDMFAELTRCKSILTKFGGHKLAAGMSLAGMEEVDQLRRMLNEAAALTEEDMMEKVSIDLQLPFAYISEQLVEELTRLEPFGKGNAKPVFVEKDITIKAMRVLGKNQNVLKLELQDAGGTAMDGIYFGDIEGFMAGVEAAYGVDARESLLNGKPAGVKAAFTYYPGVNEYMGNKKLQITVQHVRF